MKSVEPEKHYEISVSVSNTMSNPGNAVLFLYHYLIFV